MPFPQAVKIYHTCFFTVLQETRLGNSRIRDRGLFGGDFETTNFAAAAPYTCDHATGGGAFNDGTKGDYKDITEQLEGGQFTCNDIVTFLAQISIEEHTFDSDQTATFEFKFTADSTGQSGAALSEVVSVSINYGLVENGDDGS